MLTNNLHKSRIKKRKLLFIVIPVKEIWGYSKKFFEEHRAEITIHKAAKKKFDALRTKKIPRIKELSAEYDEVLAKKKNAYSEYRAARSEMQKYSVAKQNLKMIYELDSVPERNAQPSREA